ncbi:DUF3069 domain-containing protein [Shewanella sp. 1_MG-2023]|uniref:DUF3069 domain-containing protein n=1 Tax=Shewanella electrodiphila TaxID=934143 RepID=A0ABT0KKS9_9GAMM|nr:MULTISPECIES: DUF3069 domain-containing protein [Shewanella]MCC4832787.1 DUF3069 domain-containing protein [Shewanella sp. 10N.7]MCL1044447.1 DUF3069 domain-containing protein [Shewanella electrodiphila]MDO6610485.1 DUF3069 domain-containing protein [Shewanella sp. 7_MG-2023]MDO6770610.1 DUF3069 domain-containing protein [Shewanella sp. 2_MG-2023]MDO6794996.1 DUF3069 domain-containing protein [Shewanella sp. 1_MG-2023]
MSHVTEEYKATAKQVSFNVANKVLPMDKLPETLLEAYEGLFKELIEDNAGLFNKSWQAMPASAQKLMPQAEFHGFYIANAWMQLSRVAQEIADDADSDEAIDEKEYDGVFGRLAEQSLKESIRKLKKARTDRSMLNSFKQVMSA